ncbi:MAG TPA: amino acid adenylation domain-containing protein, partial [Thermoanaerobaculia bacterium]
LQRRPPAGRRLGNIYGPSEATVVTVASVVSPEGARPPSIGRPLANTRVYILDTALRPVPPGATGELCLAGANLGRGYLGRPDLTAAVFLPDPFEGAGERLYRTGDLARWLADGRIECLGRADRQVKIRGFRVEPGEVEAVLASLPGVREAAVVVDEEVPEHRRLVAWVVAEAGVGAAALCAALAERLPAQMVPAAVGFLPALPRTANGKVDRRALARRAPPGDGSNEGYEAPRTPTEELVAAMWADLLGAGRIGLRDDFFDRGGHSLLAARALARLREPFGLELPLRTLFENPTLDSFAAAVDRACREESGSPAAPPLRPVPRDGEIPLSFAQERLWVLDRLVPGSAAYNIPVGLRLTGSLRPILVSRALAEIVRRHEALRTVFQDADGRPVQVVRPAAAFPLPCADLSALPPSWREAEADRLTRAEGARPFDLAEGPVARALLLRLALEEHRLLLCLHHIVADGWSVRRLLRELGAFYGAGLPDPGKAPGLPALTVQYADYAVWQRQWLAGGTLDAQLAWWRERLAGAPASVELSADRPRPAAQTFRGELVLFAVPAEVVHGLEELARRRGATLFLTLLAGWAALLHRVTGQDDLVVGSVVAGRNREEIEPLIGVFANALPLRLDLRDDPTTAELLGRARAAALGAWSHQDVPFERLVEELQPRRDLSRSPLFQVMLAVQDGPAEGPDLPGLAVQPLPLAALHNGTAKFDLTVLLDRAGDVLTGGLELNADVLDPATGARLAEGLGRLLREMAAAPERRIADLDLLDAADRAQLVAEGLGALASYPRDIPIHRLFEEQAHRTPGRIALQADGLEMTYAELDARANRLARHLRGRFGVGAAPETPVGVALERSPEMVVAFLAILKAGGAYVPLDPSYPAERLAVMAEEVALPFVVTEEALLTELPASLAGMGDRRLLCLEREQDAIAHYAAGPLDGGAEAGHLAYVMFTSGSTGRPKPVGIEHRSVVRLVCGADYAQFGPDEVFLQLTSASFDPSTMEIWAPLLHGGRLALSPRGTASIEELGETLAQNGVTTLWLTAGLFHQVVESRIGVLRPVRQLLAGGDVLSPERVNRVLAELPGCTLINGYGPTENTCFTCCHRVRELVPPGSSVPIGRPIANTRAWIADRRLQPVPAGVAGELLAGGDGLARGYLGRPDATAERFVPDPFSGESGARVYRTGDLVRRRTDGALEFLGRIDQQVKIRGFRVEPGEVEAALLEHSAVAACAVVPRQDVPGDRRLAVYLVLAEGIAPRSGASPAELRAFLAARLPAYMVPAAFVILPALPLNPNGKVDRRALLRLPPPAGEALASAGEYARPRTPAERQIAEAWAGLLGLKQIGIHDDFFALGGHSLLAIQALSRLRDLFGVEVLLRALFEEPTAAGMAARVEAALRTEAGAGAPPLEPVPRGGPLPLSYAQERLWFLEQLEPGSAFYNIPAAARLAGPLRVGVLRACLAEMVRRHEALRTTFGDRGGQPFQEIGEPAMPG